MGALGKAPDAQGNGLTDQQHRRILWAHWATAGIIGGCEVTGTSTMAYAVAPGAVALITSDSAREAVEVGIAGVTVATVAAPGSGSRIDYIQVDSDGKVWCTQAPVAGRFTLDERTVPAGATATTSTTGVADRGYAVSTAGMLGVLDRWDEQLGHLVPIPDGVETLKAGRFVVPGDRRINIRIRHSATAAGYTDPITMPMGGESGATLYTVQIDAKVWKLVFYNGRTWGSQVDEIDHWVTAGAHTWSVKREKWVGTSAITLGNGSSNIPPSYVKIVDQGATA